MVIVLPVPLTVQEIRVLQEYRRIGVETMPLDGLKSIKHPSGGGESPARSLAGKGFLASDESGQNLTLTEKAKAFLAIEVKPEGEESGASATDVAE